VGAWDLGKEMVENDENHDTEDEEGEEAIRDVLRSPSFTWGC